MKQYILIILIIPMFVCCTESEGQRILKELGDFPWESVPDWIPYSENDTVILVNQNSDTRIYIVESIIKSYDSYRPEEKHVTTCNCEPGPFSEYAGFNCTLIPYLPQLVDNLIDNFEEYNKYLTEQTIEYEWICHRDIYRLDCRMTFNNKYDNMSFLNDNPTDKYDYNSIFKDLPDTLSYENKCFEAKIVSGKGIIMLKDVDSNETWSLMENK